KERIPLRGRQQVSWLRLTDECSGAMLWTKVFPPRPLGPRAPRGGAGATPPGLRPLGAAPPAPGRQRRAVGLGGRLPDRAGAVGDRAGGRGALERTAVPPGERRGRAVAGDVGPLVRAADLRDGRGAAGAARPAGPAAPGGLPLPGGA